MNERQELREFILNNVELVEGSKNFQNQDIGWFLSGFEQRLIKSTRWRDLKRAVFRGDDEFVLKGSNASGPLNRSEKSLVRSLQKNYDVKLDGNDLIMRGNH